MHSSSGRYGADRQLHLIATGLDKSRYEPIVLVPGVRPEGAGSNDHVRPLTPREAVEAGGDYVVVGRPVIDASDPAAAAQAVSTDLS